MNKTIFLLIPAAALALAGCATHTTETQETRANWAVGNVAAAEAEVSKMALEKEDTGDALIWKLEEGAVSRANCDFPKSLKVFNEANDSIEIFENEPDTKLSEETAAIFTNQSYIPYKGYNYDKIMLGVYQAMNYIEIKDFDNAAVQLKKLENYQRNAERLNKNRIERELKAIKNAQKQDRNANYNASRTTSDPRVGAQFAKIYGDDFKPDTTGQQAKAIYVNPFAYWISGLYFANKAVDSSDKNFAADMFRLGGEMLGNNSAVFAADFKMAEDLANGLIQKPSKITYVVYETGMAPIRKQVRIDLPLYVVAKNVPHVGVNFPYLAKQESYAADLAIMANGKKQPLDTIADMDEIVRREFNNELPMVITKTVISAAVKAAAQYGIAQAAGDGWGGLAVNILGSIYQMTMNDADLRTWTTLPKQIKVARFETPSDGIVVINGVPIEVDKENVNVIVAKRMDANGKLLLRKFDFLEKSQSPAPATKTSAKPIAAK